MLAAIENAPGFLGLGSKGRYKFLDANLGNAMVFLLLLEQLGIHPR
jgi:hypothetical protein